MNVSVVILTANRRLALETCILSLGRQTRHPDELVILDMASSDGTPTYLKSLEADFPVVSIRKESQVGFAEARNEAAQRAKGDIIAFIDDDCEADLFWLERLLRRLDGSVAVGGAVLPADSMPTPEDYSPGMAWAVGLSPPEFFGPRGGRDVLPQTANLAFKRSLLEKYPFQAIGGRLGQGTDNYAIGREDAEWWRRLRRAGEPVCVEPRAIVWHHIERDRFETETLMKRVRLDGAALWRREKPRHLVQAAAADIVAAPLAALHRTLEPRCSDTQAWGESLAWAARQNAFLAAGVNDPGSGIAPTERTSALITASVRLVAGGLKSCIRPVLAAAYHAATPELDPPFIGPGVKRVLAVLHPFLGDSVLALPLLRQLRKGLPAAELVLATGESNHALLDDQLDGWDVVKVPPGAVGHSPGAVAGLRAFIKAQRPEAILVLYAHGLSPAPFFMERRAITVGWTHDAGMSHRLWGQLHKVPVEKRWDQHESTALLNLLSPFGIAAVPEAPVVTPGEVPRERVAEVLKRFGIRPRSYIVLHVEKDTHPKYWFQEGWAALAGLLEKTDHRVVLEGSKAGRAAADLVRSVLPSAVTVHGALNSADLAAFLSQALAFVGADSGPQHVAAAVGCPSLVLFGPTDENRWGPLPALVNGHRDPRRVLRAAPADWTHEEREALGESTSMKRIPHERVFRELTNLLEGASNGA